MIERGNVLPLARQAALLRLSRSSVYYLPRPVPPARLAIMHRIEALHSRPNTSKHAPGHKIYLYHLRDLPVDRPNQVWAMDITYIPMGYGFVCLAALVDCFSRIS